MKESRLFQILYYILDKGRVTATELAEKFEVSERTIYRDIDWISSAGIPIFTSKGRNGGIEIDSSYVLKKAILSDEERDKMVIALKTLEDTDFLHRNELISKLSSLFQVNNENWIEVDLTNWQCNKSYKKVFDSLKNSIMSKKIISMNYFNGNSKQSKRTVKPIRLLFKGQDWYLYGFCMLREDFRFFKLSRIKNLEILDTVYDDDFSDITINKELEYENMINLKLKFDKKIAFRVYDELSDAIIEDDEYIYADLSLPDNSITYSYILSFANYAEVIEPEKIRRKIKEIINEMGERYKN